MMGMCMCASKRECMDFPKHVLLHKNSWKNGSSPRAIIKVKSTLVSGTTNGVQFPLHSVSTTSASNMSGKSTLTIYSQLSRSIMKYPVTVMAHATLDSPYKGTTTTASSNYPCRATAKKPVSGFTTPNQPNHNTNLIPVHHAHMARNTTIL